LTKGETNPGRGARLEDASQAPPSPAEFIRQCKPQGGTLTITALAYYLDHFTNEAEFGLKNINQLARRAKIKDLHPQYLVEAVKQGFITEASARGLYRITQTGEAKIEGLGVAG
jgi:hypothetical protein